MMMKRLFFLFLLAAYIQIGYGNNRSYYENLLKLTAEEIDNRNYTKVLEYSMKVKIYAKENNCTDLEVEALIFMGIAYMEILNYEKAIECYLESYQIASGKFKDQQKIRILNNISALYVETSDLDKAIEYLDMAYEITIKSKESEKSKDRWKIILLHNMSLISNKKKNLEQTEKYLNTAMEILKNKPQDLFETRLVQFVQIEYLYFKKEYDSAEQLALEVLKEERLETGRLEQNLKIAYLFLLSQIYFQKENFPQAIFYAKETLKNSSKFSDNIEIYEHLSKLYRTTHSLSLAMQYQDSAMMLKDSLLKLNNISQILRGQVQFDLNNMEKKMAENKAKQKRNHLVFVFVIIFIIVLFLLVLYIRSTKLKQLKMMAKLELEKEKLELEKEKNAKLLLEQEIKERETLALLERNMYKNEIELKNRQLISQTLLQLSKNELIEEIINLLSAPKRLKNSEMLPIIKKLQAQIKETADANWNSFLGYFEQTNSAFLSTLKAKHPNLTTNDIRLSSYIYLNLETKEIAEMLHITPESYKKRKRFLAQKLGLPTPEIYHYLSNIV